jgi:GNAT superfamily N-acetyltransferase
MSTPGNASRQTDEELENMKNDSHSRDAPLSHARQAWLMLVVIAPMAACYPAIKTGLEFAPSLRFAGLRTLVGGLSLLLVLVIRRKPLWPGALLARWILPLGLVATTLTFGAMFASPAYTGAGIASVLGNNLVLIWVQPDDESAIKHAFEKTLAVRRLNAEARELAGYQRLISGRVPKWESYTTRASIWVPLYVGFLFGI